MDGKFVGGEIPFGFRLKSLGVLEVSEPQAAIIRRIFEEAAEGRTPSEIAADLRSVNERRTSRKNPKGTPWNATVVRQFLENPRYRGVQYLGEKEYHQEHGGIVSSDLWNLANARLPEVTPVMRDAINSPFLLVGRGTCGICGQPLAAYEANGRSRKYAYYTCRRARKALGGKPCQLGNIRVDQLEHLIFEAIAVLGKHPALCRATAEAMLPEKSTSFLKHKKRLQEVDVRIDEIERSLPSVRELISSKVRPALSERMRDEMEALLSEQNKLLDEKRLLVAKLSFEKQRASNVSLVAEALGKMPMIFSALPATQRRELVGLLVQNVLVKPFDGESPGISDGALMITPQVGTKRFLVKISIYEKDLLSTAFTNSVDGSTLAEIGCPHRRAIRRSETGLAGPEGTNE